jgi:hypothetical protein
MRNSNEEQHEDSEQRNDSLPILRGWWAELPISAKVLVPMTAAVLVLVAANALPLPLPL